jgi:hypothetical protein
MTFEGRLLDLGDQIHCVRWFFFLAASRGGARGIPWYSSEYQCFFQHKAKEL